MARILAVTATNPPHPQRDVEGHYKRLKLFMAAIGTLGGTVDMLHFVPQDVIDENPDAKALNALQSEYWGFPVAVELFPRRERAPTFYNYYLKGILAASEQPSFYDVAGPQQAAFLDSALDRGYDLVFVHYLDSMGALLRTRRRPQAVAFDLGDVEHRKRLRASLQPPVQPGKLLGLTHVPAILAAERNGVARSQRTFVCSETDRKKLAQLGISRGVTVVPNAVRMPAEQQGLTREPHILYIGDYGYPPNKEGVERLALRILPMIRERVPDAKLLLVGKRAETLSRDVAVQPGVDLLGFVEDLDALYARVRVVCCPLINGGGTRVKLIEGAAYGKPLVATRVGAEGLDFADGTEILLAEDDAGLAEACVRLLGDDGLCERLGHAARDKVRHEYQAENIQDRIARLLREVMRREAPQ